MNGCTLYIIARLQLFKDVLLILINDTLVDKLTMHAMHIVVPQLLISILLKIHVVRKGHHTYLN